MEKIGAGGSLLVACSGGGDSLALLRACVELRDASGSGSVTAGYFDHRQRSSSQADGSAVASFAEAWGCAFLTGAFDGPRGASEAELRTARYAWLADAAAAVGGGWVLTGHTAGDRAETVLLRLLRGTGVAGLAGIAASGPVPGRADAAVTVGRPMLRLAGREAREFLTVRGLRWVEDPSNAAADYTRNRLRRDLLPRLTDFNPRWEEAVLRLADGAAGGAAVTAALAEKVADRAVLFARERQIEVWEHELDGLPDAARIAVFRAAWKRAGWPEGRMSAAAWRRLGALRDGQRTELPHGVKAAHATGEIVLRR